MEDHDRIVALEKRVHSLKENYDASLDTIWMLFAATLVFFMHAGFSLLEAGAARVKNVQKILVNNLLVLCTSFCFWYCIGWPLAFGATDDPMAFMGRTGYFMNNFLEDKELCRRWLFAGMFCATSATIVSGAMAERTQLKGLGIFTMIMTSIVYPIVAHWTWSNHGFMSYHPGGDRSQPLVSVFGAPYIDFAGSGVVHLVGGISAVIGAGCVGPRLGRFQELPDDEFTSHSVPLSVLGTFFLWFGWYGFNPGSVRHLNSESSANLAALVAVNTTMAPCISGLTVFLMRAKYVPPRKLDIGGFCNGILAGLVTITAGCAIFDVWETLIVGSLGGIFYQFASMLLPKYHIDDVVDASAVHGAVGLWAVLSVGIFGSPNNGGNGLLYGGDQFKTQLMCALVIIIWVMVTSFAIFIPLRVGGILRLSDKSQEQGADRTEYTPQMAYFSGEKAKQERINRKRGAGNNGNDV